MSKTCIIVGASHAGSQAAISLRQSGWSGAIVLIGAEAVPPYHRPPLSKDFLKGGKEIDEILLRPVSTYESADIDLIPGERVARLDRGDRLIFLKSGATLQYDKLILATGAYPRELPIPGGDIPGVMYLRTAADVLAIKDKVRPGGRAVIIGGGYIGLETAASLRAQDMDVTVLEMEDRILQRVTAPVMSDFYRRIHTEEGVRILESCAATHILGGKTGMTIVTNTEETLDADLLIVGIGVIPDTAIAKQAGLEVGNGIVVNEFCQTSDPDIYAIGDVAWHHNPLYDIDLRLESVPNATDQAKTAAAHICGRGKPYAALPWFWSDQYDLKLQIAGLSSGYDAIVLRGTPDKGRSFAAFYFRGETLIAVDAVNRPQEYMIGKRLIPLALKGKTIDKTALADEDIPLKDLLK